MKLTVKSRSRLCGVGTLFLLGLGAPGSAEAGRNAVGQLGDAPGRKLLGRAITVMKAPGPRRGFPTREGTILSPQQVVGGVVVNVQGHHQPHRPRVHIKDPLLNEAVSLAASSILARLREATAPTERFHLQDLAKPHVVFGHRSSRARELRSLTLALAKGLFVAPTEAKGLTLDEKTNRELIAAYGQSVPFIIEALSDIARVDTWLFESMTGTLAAGRRAALFGWPSNGAGAPGAGTAPPRQSRGQTLASATSGKLDEAPLMQAWLEALGQHVWLGGSEMAPLLSRPDHQRVAEAVTHLEEVQSGLAREAAAGEWVSADRPGGKILYH